MNTKIHYDVQKKTLFMGKLPKAKELNRFFRQATSKSNMAIPVNDLTSNDDKSPELGENKKPLALAMDFDNESFKTNESLAEMDLSTVQEFYANFEAQHSQDSDDSENILLTLKPSHMTLINALNTAEMQYVENQLKQAETANRGNLGITQEYVFEPDKTDNLTQKKIEKIQQNHVEAFVNEIESEAESENRKELKRRTRIQKKSQNQATSSLLTKRRSSNGSFRS